jgi:hypothetical protein
MTRALAAGIKQQRPELLAVFAPPFQSVAHWSDYITRTFGRDQPSVDSVLAKPELAVTDFHALYIACWIHYPVEKGSYMLKLSETQREHVKAGYAKLGLRLSSHLEGHGRSAGAGWTFLKGYEELLVQLEGGGKNSPGEEKYLFLKSEGHPMVSVGHMKSWAHKAKAGKGLTASDGLHQLATSSAFDIHERAAENFENSYKAFLKYLGIYDAQKKMTTVQAAVASWYALMTKLMNMVPSCKSELSDRLQKAGIPIDLQASAAGKLDNVSLAKLINDVLLPVSKAMHAKNFDNDDRTPTDELLEFGTQVQSASTALSGIAHHLADDASLTGDAHVTRFFEEVRVAPASLDISLAIFLAGLRGS